MEAGLSLAAFSWRSRTSKLSFVPLHFGTRQFATFGIPGFIFPRLGHARSLSSNVPRQLQTLSSSLYGRAQFSTMCYHKSAIGAGSLLVCFACSGHGRCDLPAESGPATLAASAGVCHTCALPTVGWSVLETISTDSVLCQKT